MQEDEPFLNLTEQAKLQDILAENNGKLFPDELEIQNVSLFQTFLKKALEKTKEKAKDFLMYVSMGITQRSISEQGKADFIQKYQIAQNKINRTKGVQQERSL